MATTTTMQSLDTRVWMGLWGFRKNGNSSNPARQICTVLVHDWPFQLPSEQGTTRFGGRPLCFISADNGGHGHGFKEGS